MLIFSMNGSHFCNKSCADSSALLSDDKKSGPIRAPPVGELGLQNKGAERTTALPDTLRRASDGARGPEPPAD